MYGFPLERGYQRAIEYSRSNTGGGGGGGESYPNAYWKRIGGHFARTYTGRCIGDSFRDKLDKSELGWEVTSLVYSLRVGGIF